MALDQDSFERRAIERLVKAADKAYETIALNGDENLTAEEHVACEELRKAVAYAKRGVR